MFKNKYSGRVWTLIALSGAAYAMCLTLITMGLMGAFELGRNMPTLAIFGLFASGSILAHLTRYVHRQDLLFANQTALFYNQPIPTGRQLTIDERVGLAARFYGLYMFPMELANAKMERNESIQIGKFADLSNAMDNMRVPFVDGQLNEEERNYLAMMAAQRELRAAEIRSSHTP